MSEAYKKRDGRTWYSCSEVMPEEHMPVLFYTNGMFYIAHWDPAQDEMRTYSGAFLGGYKDGFWRELPTPPEQDTQ